MSIKNSLYDVAWRVVQQRVPYSVLRRFRVYDDLGLLRALGRELMAPRTDRTTRIPSGVASPVTTNHAAKGSVFVNLRNGGNLKIGFMTTLARRWRTSLLCALVPNHLPSPPSRFPHQVCPRLSRPASLSPSRHRVRLSRCHDYQLMGVCQLMGCIQQGFTRAPRVSGIGKKLVGLDFGAWVSGCRFVVLGLGMAAAVHISSTIHGVASHLKSLSKRIGPAPRPNSLPWALACGRSLAPGGGDSPAS